MTVYDELTLLNQEATQIKQQIEIKKLEIAHLEKDLNNKYSEIESKLSMLFILMMKSLNK